MMLLRKKTIIGLIICTLILSASVPLLLGIEATPRTIFGGDMVAVSQVNASVRLNSSLVDELKQQPQVQSASAEIPCFCVINGYPTIVRGVNINDFLAIENGTLITGEVEDENRFAVIGKNLIDKVNLDVGDKFLLTGSSNSALFQMEIDAVYESKYSDDELLVPLEYARKMAGIGIESALFIRVRTNNQSALVDVLEVADQPVVVTNSQGLITPVNTNISEEDRIKQQLAIKYLDTAQFEATNGSYISLFVQEGVNSIRVVVGTFIILDGVLAFIGSSAIVSRAVIERRNEIGIISAIGANRNYICRLVLRDMVILSTLASLTGVLLGYAVVLFIEGHGLLLMFGETIHPVINIYILFGIFAISVMIQVCSGYLVGYVLTKVRPRTLLQETEMLLKSEDTPRLESILSDSSLHDHVQDVNN